MNYEKLIKESREFAIEKHGNQMYGDKPYIYHLDEVHSLAIHYNLPPIYQVTAYLHDLLEDQNVSKDEIVNKFGIEAYNMVFAVSGFGETRKERSMDIRTKLESNIEAIDLKMIDRIANVKNSILNKPKLLNMYKKEHADYMPIFTKGSKIIFNDLNKLLNIENTMMNVNKVKKNNI